ncbi:hypothetical protein MMAR_3890 [Mycobacterium marinum M]|uniref:Uncharacterized protein n=2 Tax=Mycobacterium marinum TaxID=1781 RepID=B2HNP9_MYCMM|nr:hypothetical protein MMAR_3890 [Mycobacterium marinum M]
MAAGSAGRGTPPIEAPEGAQSAVSDEDKAKAEAVVSASAKDKSSERYVFYTGAREAVRASKIKDPVKREARIKSPGVGSFCEVTATQWSQAGIKATHGHVWKLQNEFRIPASQFTQEQIDHLLSTQGKRFELVDGNGKKVAR